MSSDQWSSARLGDLVEVVHGFAFKTRYADSNPSPYVLFTRKNVALGGGFREDAPRYYHGSFEDRFLLSPGDIMLVLTDLSRDGDLLGLPAIVPQNNAVRYLHNQRVGKVVLRNNSVDSGFLYALFRSPEYRRYVLNTASQTTVRDTAPSRLHDYIFALPPLDEQRRIASVLGAFDDKIDSNRRLADRTETVIGCLYSQLERLQRDDRVSLGSIAERIVERVSPAVGWADEPLIDLGRMPRESLTLWWVGTGKELATAVTRFRRGDLLFGAIRPYFHKCGMAPHDGVTNTSVMVIRAKREQDAPLVVAAGSSQAAVAWAVARSGGTKMPTVAWADLAEFQVANPTMPAAQEFGTTARPLFDTLPALIAETRSLETVRDTLLPKLISGAIRVSNATDSGELIGSKANAVNAE